ncbi:hypothetical protein Tco_0637845 [Tanacetum coccineum]
MPSISSPEPAISCFNDLDIFNDFENEFPAIVYNDAQTSKLYLLTEPILNPRHIDKFDLNDETSLSKYDEEEQNVLYFNDLFPFNIIRPDDLKTKKDNDDNDIDIIHSLEGNEIIHGLCVLSETSRLARIHRREVHRVQVFDFGGLPDLMTEGLSARMLMEHWDSQGVSLFGQAILDLDTPGALQFQLGGSRRHMSWREFILALELYTAKEMQTVGFGISSAIDFLGTTLSDTAIRDPILRLCHRLIACSIAGRSQGLEKSGMHISSGQLIARLVEHFGLLTTKILGGLTVIALKLPIIDMERQPDDAADTPRVAQDASIVDEGGQADPTPVQVPPSPPPAPARTVPQRMARLEENLHEICRALIEQREVIDAMACDFSRDVELDKGPVRPTPLQHSMTRNS